MARMLLSAVVAVLLLACSARGAGARSLIVLDPTGVSVAAYGGWAAWSRPDGVTGDYGLVLRSPQGGISLPAIAEQPAPFDVELGPAGRSQVAAVYSRCTNAAARTGCHVIELRLGVSGAVERALSPPGGGSDHEPAIWNGALVFLRRRSSAGSRRPDDLLLWQIGSRRAKTLALPSSRGARSGVGSWPRGLTGSITGLSFNGKQVAYVTANSIGSFAESTLWFEPLGGRPELIDQETGGAGNVCPPEFVSPVLAGPWLYAYLHACDPSADPHLDRLTRYRRGEVQRAAYTFIHFGDDEISSIVLDGAGVDWGSDGVERLSAVSWRRIAAPLAETFCSRSDPFC